METEEKSLNMQCVPCAPRQATEQEMAEYERVSALKKENTIKEIKQMCVDLDVQLQKIKDICVDNCYDWQDFLNHQQYAAKSCKEAIMWLGMVLKSIGEPTPYPNSYNPENAIVERTADGMKM